MSSPKIMDTVSIHGDEYYTLPLHVNDICDCLKPLNGGVIWLPFDRDDSEFTKVMRDRGFNVVNTSTDFFCTDPPEGCCAIISNPPFSRKRDVLKRVRELDIPFALLLPALWVNDGVPFDYGNQMIWWRKRVYFMTPYGVKNNARTTCFVLSNGLLKQDLTIINH